MTWTPSDTTDAIQSVVGLTLSFANDGLLQFARGGSLMETVYQNCTTGRSNLFESHRQRRWLTVVSYANLKKLAKQIKTDHRLAEDLWASGNHDARVLGCMVADPEALTKTSADKWARDLDCYPITDAFSGLIARTAHSRSRFEKWSTSNGEWLGRSGWQLLAHLAMSDDELPDSYFDAHLGTIETEIHNRKNRVRDAMNSALIAIGIRKPRLRKRALAAAKRIGKIEVDHGETGCKTPDAAIYIKKAVERKAKKATS